MSIPFYFRPRTTVICLLFALLFARLSYWQWERHQHKLTLIAEMKARVGLEPVPLSSLASEKSWDSHLFRRVRVEGTFDFAHEMVLRNRRFKGNAGVFVLTPLKIAGSDQTVLVNRGFLPLSRASRVDRSIYHMPASTRFLGLIKEPSSRRFLAPADPPAGPSLPWVDAWLRVDLESIQKQLPYPLLPIYLETVDDLNPHTVEQEMIKESSEREEILSLANRQAVKVTDLSHHQLPIPIYDTYVSAGRHLGYVFEWGGMSVVTLLIAVILQLRPWRQDKTIPT
jgi:surfeit locus 1 family protein